MGSSKRQCVYIVSPTESDMTERGKRHPDLALRLVKEGWRVHYVTTTFNHTTKTLFDAERILECGNRLPYSLTALDVGSYQKNVSFARVRWNQKFARRCHACLRDVVREGDVVVVPSRPPELVYAVAQLKSRFSVRVILDIRDVWPDALTMSSRLTKMAFGLYCNLFLKAAVDKCDSFIHVAPSFLQWLTRYAPGKDSTFIPLGYDSKRWQEIEPKQGGCGKRTSLVYVGLLQKQIDVRPVIEAMAGRPNWALTIIGDDGQGERFRQVRRFVQEHKVHNISFVGRLSPPDVPRYLKNHDVGIVPMLSSSIPNKVFDYMGACLPIISLGENDASNFVRRHDIGWCAPFCAQAVGSLLDRLTPTEILAKAKCVESIRHMYARETLLERFVEVIGSHTASSDNTGVRVRSKLLRCRRDGRKATAIRDDSLPCVSTSRPGLDRAR